MKKFNLSVIALSIGLTFSVGAMAEGMTKSELKSHEKTIDADYKLAKEKCGSLSGNANDICIAEAKGNKSVAEAELEATYKPSIKARYESREAKADADYAVAIEKCDDKAGNEKDVCVKEAKAVRVHQIADAKTRMKSSDANAEANETSSAANQDAMEKKTEANKDANQEKRDADYVVAKEKCDAMAGSAKDQCIIEAKAKFGS